MTSPSSQKQATKILVADDDTVVRRMLQKHLSGWGYQPLLVENGNAAWKALRRKKISMAVLDWMMPGMPGPELVRKIRNAKKSEYTYIILLSARGDRRDVLAGLSSGADDYMTKPFHPEELRVRLQVGERILRLEKNLLQAKQRLQKLAFSDSITGLWTRRKIMEFLKEEQARSLRQGHPLGLILLDIDHFKKINDRHGHPAGDSVLAELAHRLVKISRPYDRLGRIGGDELMILVPGCNRDSTRKAAERLRQAVAARPFSRTGKKIPVTVSLGAATTDDLPRAGQAALIHAADQALYQAKKRGRNITVVHIPEKGR